MRGQEPERFIRRESCAVRNTEPVGEDLVDQQDQDGVQTGPRSMCSFSDRVGSKCVARREISSEFQSKLLAGTEGISNGDDDMKVSTEPSSSEDALTECGEDDVTSGGLLERGGKSFSMSTFVANSQHVRPSRVAAFDGYPLSSR
jgi:hypothetical protein